MEKSLKKEKIIDTRGERNNNYRGGNRLVGLFPCPQCKKYRKCEKRNAYRKCWECHVNRPSNFSRTAWHHKTKKETKRWAIDYKGGKCALCGNADLPLPCYQFHHIDPKTKLYNPGKLIVQKPSKKLKAELDKCILLCANCHMIVEHTDIKTDLTSLTYS